MEKTDKVTNGAIYLRFDDMEEFEVELKGKDER